MATGTRTSATFKLLHPVPRDPARVWSYCLACFKGVFEPELRKCCDVRGCKGTQLCAECYAQNSFWVCVECRQGCTYCGVSPRFCIGCDHVMCEKHGLSWCFRCRKRKFGTE